MSIKNFNDPSGNRTRDLSVRSTVPQPTAPPSRLPHHHPIADSKCILHEGYLRCSQNIKSEEEISEYVIFFPSASSKVVRRQRISRPLSHLKMEIVPGFEGRA
jgi:hypothetical protein